MSGVAVVWLLSVVPISVLDVVTKANKLPPASEWRAEADKGDRVLGRE